MSDSPHVSSTESHLLEDAFWLEQEQLLEIERNHPLYSQLVLRVLQEAFEAEGEPQYVRQGEVYDWLESLLT